MREEAERESRRKSDGRIKIAAWVFLILSLFLMVFPLFVLVTDSFLGSREILERFGPVLAGTEGRAEFVLFPQYPTLRAYVRLLLDSPDFFTAFWNSAFQTGMVLAGQLAVAVPGAWAFARYRFPGKRALWFFYMLLMILPFQVTMVSGYLVLNTMGLMDTHWAVILPGIFSTLPVFILKKTFAAIPGEILEAAEMDGAGEMRMFFSIGIPLGRSGIFSILILGFLEYWNAIEQPMTFLKSEALKPLSLYLPDITASDAAVSFVASIIMLFPALFLFFSGQEYLEQGIAASGIKE